jgi:hypothetical protein
MTDGGAHGLMDLMECLEKLIPEGPITTYVSRSGWIDLASSALKVAAINN